MGGETSASSYNFQLFVKITTFDFSRLSQQSMHHNDFPSFSHWISV